MRNYVPKAARHKWSDEAMQKAIEDALKSETSIHSVASLYNVPYETLRRKVNNAQFAAATENENPNGFQNVFSAQEEELLVKLILESESKLLGFKCVDVRRLAFQLAEKCKKNHPFNKTVGLAGKDWMTAFFKRHPQLTIRKPEKTSGFRALGFNETAVSNFFSILEPILTKHKLPPSRIYNCDETGLTVVPKQTPKIIAPLGKRQVGFLTSAERGETVTVEICFSAAGVYMPMMFVYPRVRNNPDLMKGAPEGSWAEFHPSGHVQSDIFFRWLKKFIEFSGATKDAPVLLILDGHSSHVKNLALIELAQENGVIIVCLPPHTTHKMQPVDVSFNKPFSDNYTNEMSKWLRANRPKVLTIYNVADLAGKAFIKTASMDLAVNGFRKTGIYPFNPKIFQPSEFEPSTCVLDEKKTMDKECSSDNKDVADFEKTLLDIKQEIFGQEPPRKKEKIENQSNETTSQDNKNDKNDNDENVALNSSSCDIDQESSIASLAPFLTASDLSKGQLYLLKNNKLIPLKLDDVKRALNCKVVPKTIRNRKGHAAVITDPIYKENLSKEKEEKQKKLQIKKQNKITPDAKKVSVTASPFIVQTPIPSSNFILMNNSPQPLRFSDLLNQMSTTFNFNRENPPNMISHLENHNMIDSPFN